MLTILFTPISARFQLFGDTVNTASRIETTGEKNRIHLSEETANLLISMGKERWVMERTNRVEAKGQLGATTGTLCATNAFTRPLYGSMQKQDK